MKKIILYTALVSLLISSCSEVDFGDTNVDPNAPSAPLASALLTNALTRTEHIYSATRPSMYVQYLANEQYEDESLYRTQRFDYTYDYVTLTTLNKIINLNTDPETADLVGANQGSNANQIAVSRLIKAFIFHTMTDRWGMLPYTTANQGLESKFNVFDSQLDIYTALLKETEDAIAQIDSGSGPTGDIFFDGNMDMWKTFGNTMMMNMAMRLSKKAPTLGQEYFNKAINGGVIASNNENIYYPYLASEDYDNPWEDRFTTRSDYLISEPFANALIGTGTNTDPEDPRLEKYSDLSVDTDIYNGAEYGAVNSDTKAYSLITSDIIKNQEAKGYFYTYAQVLLHMAEAAQLGWISSDTAENYTKMGVRASMEQWGVETADIDTYIAGMPAFEGQKTIAYQKWVALFLQGYEAWSEWRKQGDDQVALSKPLAATTDGIPQRQAYPLSAGSANEENYNAAVAEQGEDDLDTKVWWAN